MGKRDPSLRLAFKSKPIPIGLEIGFSWPKFAKCP